MIPKFNPYDTEVLSLVNSIILQHPVAHLRHEEVEQTMRLIQLEQALKSTNKLCVFPVTVGICFLPISAAGIALAVLITDGRRLPSAVS